MISTRNGEAIKIGSDNSNQQWITETRADAILSNPRFVSTY